MVTHLEQVHIHRSQPLDLSMQLTGAQVQQIQDALLDGYSTQDELRIMVRIKLGQRLDAIVDGGNVRVLAFNLVSWAEQTDRVGDLVEGAAGYNPGNEALRQVRDEWRAAMSGAAGSQPSAMATSGAPRVSILPGPVSIDIFLSYSRKDLEIMRNVRDSLREAGLSVWTDEGLKPGTRSWIAAIEEAIVQAQAMVVLLSPNARASDWVQRELEYADAQGKRILPLLIDGDKRTSVPISLIRVQWTDGRQDARQATTHDLLPVLLEELGRATAQPVLPAPSAFTPEPAK
jgi:hypothetical protein